MKKIYESQNSLVVTTENEDVSNPIYVFYKSKVALINYLSPNPKIVDDINELKEVIKSIILYGRQTNQYKKEIDFFTRFIQIEKEAGFKENDGLYSANKKRLERLLFFQEKPIDVVLGIITGGLL